MLGPPEPHTVLDLAKRFGDKTRIQVLTVLCSHNAKEPPRAAISAAAPAVLPPAAPAIPLGVPSLHQPTAALVSSISSSPVVEPKFTDDEISSMRKELPLAEWSSSDLHERALAYMRWRRDDAISRDSTLATSFENASDLRLWRFLVATSFRAAEAAHMYLEALRWRREHGMDSVRDELVEGNPEFFGGSTTSLQKPHITAADLSMMEARPRTFYRKVGDLYELLQDKQGNLLYIEVPSAVDPAAVCALSDSFLSSELRSQELLQLIIDELSVRKPPFTRIHDQAPCFAPPSRPFHAWTHAIAL